MINLIIYSSFSSYAVNNTLYITTTMSPSVSVTRVKNASDAKTISAWREDDEEPVEALKLIVADWLAEPNNYSQKLFSLSYLLCVFFVFIQEDRFSVTLLPVDHMEKKQI